MMAARVRSAVPRCQRVRPELEVRRLRSANARLREVVTSKDELSAGKDTLIEAQREQLGNYADTVRLHADRAQVQDQLVDAQEELIDRPAAGNAELRRRLSMDSSSCRFLRIVLPRLVVLLPEEFATVVELEDDDSARSK
jgi:hypothetical protein